MTASAGKTVLVTGGAGYIGSHACKALAKAGYTPLVVDNLSSGRADFVKWGKLVQGDLEDVPFLRKVFKEHSIDGVMHFASLINVGESVKKPLLYYENNVIPATRLLQVMLEFNVRKIIFSSTCAVYGSPEIIPMHEQLPRLPVNPYGKTKWTIENMLMDLVEAGELSAVALRYFNACGADLEGEVGEDHNPETHLIPLAIRAAYDPGYTLKIFGTDYPTKDGTCIRDYVHVTDLAEAHVLALDSLRSEPHMDTYNLGSAQGYSIYEIIREIESVSGRKVKYTLEDRRAGDPAVLVADSKKIKSQLGWQPKHSDLRTIIQSAIRWHYR